MHLNLRMNDSLVEQSYLLRLIDSVCSRSTVTEDQRISKRSVRCKSAPLSLSTTFKDGIDEGDNTRGRFDSRRFNTECSQSNNVKGIFTENKVSSGKQNLGRNLITRTLRDQLNINNLAANSDSVCSSTTTCR